MDRYIDYVDILRITTALIAEIGSKNGQHGDLWALMYETK
jgi:hypothetical protein